MPVQVQIGTRDLELKVSMGLLRDLYVPDKRKGGKDKNQLREIVDDTDSRTFISSCALRDKLKLVIDFTFELSVTQLGRPNLIVFISLL